MVRHHHRRNVRLALLLLAALGASAGAQEISEPLTAVTGDPARGKAVAVNSDMGNCLICHDVTIPELTPGSSGDIGPSLDGVGSRLSEGELRQRIVDPRVIAPDTLMPAYHSKEGFTRVDPRYAGKPILDAQEVEDLIAFLLTLK